MYQISYNFGKNDGKAGKKLKVDSYKLKVKTSVIEAPFLSYTSKFGLPTINHQLSTSLHMPIKNKE